MKILPFSISIIVTTGLVLLFNSNIAPLGRLLSPQHGIWQNAESTTADFNIDIKSNQLNGKVQVYMDDRLVPHVFAENESDVYFVQGYLHAKFRLWQMELQTYAAAGRASEIIGNAALTHDREFRRLGMVYAAENSLKEMEADAEMKTELDKYTAGINSYIESLTESQLPIEYKLIGYQPEKWTNLKTALFLKYMSYDLAGGDDDFEMTSAKSYFSKEDFDKLFPLTQDSLDPIISKGTVFSPPKIIPKSPPNVDSVYFDNKDIASVNEEKPDKENGSNNWAVSGKKTKSGVPILCNDPHLGLNLPSLWFEMQLSTPGFNAYGATFPGAPGVIIGFNDNCAFGFTNGGRDVRDYYEIKFKDNTRKEYWFNNEWKQTDFRIEHIKIKDAPDYLDTVAYTVFGPVMYDKTFKNDGEKKFPQLTGDANSYAVRWKAHDSSNELKVFTLLNRAKDYADYSAAITNLHTPGQNCVFACKSGDIIAIRAQGDFPAKWRGQGDFIMPGYDSSYMWQDMIPQDEVPFQYNPERGFVSSANQKPTDSTYPYYLGRDYPPYRGLYINRELNAMNNITVQDMMTLQTSNYDVFAEMAKPVFIKNMKEEALTTDEKKYLDIYKAWNNIDDVHSKAATIFDVLWNNFDSTVYNDEYANAPKNTMRPFESTLLEAVLKDTAYKFLDDITTTQKETLQDDVTAAFKKACIQLKSIDKEGNLEWAKYKGTGIFFLAKVLTPFSRLNLPVGGGKHCINATKRNHGPSWRMIVNLTPETEAYGIYPGGQSGNPGSKYYDDYVDKWVAGKYNVLWMMKKEEAKDKRIKWEMSFSN